MLTHIVLPEIRVARPISPYGLSVTLDCEGVILCSQGGIAPRLRCLRLVGRHENLCTTDYSTGRAQLKCRVSPPFKCSAPVRPIVKIFVTEFHVPPDLSGRNFELLGPQNRTGMHVKQPKKTHWNNTYVFSKTNSAKFSGISRLYVFIRSQKFLQS